MDGIVNLLKPPGMTSSNVVSDARALFSQKRAGHLGTLDPGAGGVLPVCFGRATRLFDLLVDKEKEYVFELAIGVKTDTQDVFGRVLAQSDRIVARDKLEELLPFMVGAQTQEASIYSALKVDGKKMYDLARAGEAVEPKTRQIQIFSLELLDERAPNRFLMRMRCSRGTYVRALCESIGERLGVYAHMSFLLRTRSGPFDISDAFTFDELACMRDEGRLEKALISCEAAAGFLPALTLPADRRTPSVNGLDTFLRGTADGTYRVYCGEEFLGVGCALENRLRLTLHLY